LSFTGHRLLQATEFAKSIDIDGYQFFEGNQVFVIWEWEWLEEADSDAESDASEVDQNHDIVPTDDNDTEVDDEDIPDPFRYI